MNKVNPAVAVGVVIVVLIGVAFLVFRSAGSSDANGDNTLIPKPRPGSPTFAPRQADLEAGKGKTHKAP